MKRNLLLLIVSLITISSFGQNSRLVFSNENVASYKQATTMVMLKENDLYCKILKKVIEENWTFNKYEFTTEEKLKATYKEKAPLPMVGFFEGYSNYAGSYETVLTTGIQAIGFVTVFKSKKYYNMKKKEVVHAFDLGKLKELTSEESIEAFLTHAIQDINNYLIVMGNPDNKVRSRKAYWKYVNKKDLNDFKGKIILISQKDVYNKKFKNNDVAAKEYNYKIVSQERIVKAIIDKEDVLIHYSDSFGHINWAKNGELLAANIGSNESGLFKEFRKR